MKTLTFYLIVLAIFYLGSIVSCIYLGIQALQEQYSEYEDRLFTILISLFGSISLIIAGVFLFKIIREKMKELYKLDKNNKELIKKNSRLLDENIRLLGEIN